MQLYKTTHETDWRRVQWVHDEDYNPVGSYAFADDKETQAAVDTELTGLQNGTLVALGALVETKCPHCKFWQTQDSLWGIVVDTDEDLEAWGTESLDIPEKPVDPNSPEGGCSDAPWKSLNNDTEPNVTEQRQIPLSPEAQDYVERAAETSPEAAAIRLVFDPDTLRKLRTALSVRGMSGNAGGLLDAFMVRLVEKLDAGETDWLVKQKKAVD